MLDDNDSLKLRKTLRKHVSDRSLTLSATLIDLMAVNRVSKPGKMTRDQLESYTSDVLNLIDYTQHLPQRIPLTKTFIDDVLDPVTTVTVPTGMYRVTMRKLLRLTLSQLQQQAELMRLDVFGLDEEGVAAVILINLTEVTPLIYPLIHMLLSKEIARVYGIKIEIPLKGSDHPSATTTIVIKPIDMIQSVLLTQEDLLGECHNQGVAVNSKETKQQLAVRLVVWWSAHPDQLREPFTPKFMSFLMEIAR